MPKFHVRDAFEKPLAKTFNIVGTSDAPDIHPGMAICIPINDREQLNLGIEAVHTAIDDDTGEETHQVIVLADENCLMELRKVTLSNRIFELKGL